MKKTLFLSILAMALTLAALWYEHRPVPPPHEATWEEVQAEAKNGGYRLISTEELARLYRQEPQNLLLVDTRQDWEYRGGYLQGAVNFPIEPTWWGRWRAQGKMATLLGPDKNRLAVFY